MAATVTLSACSVSLSGSSASSASSKTKTKTTSGSTVYGEVTAVDGNQITLALETMDNQQGGMQQGGMTPGSDGTASGSTQGTAPQMPGSDGTASGSTQGTAPQMPGSDGTASGSTQGTAPQMPGSDGTASGSTQGTAPQMPGSDGTVSGSTQGTAPQGGFGGTTSDSSGTNGQMGGKMGNFLTKTGETLTIAVTDTGILSKQNFGQADTSSSAVSLTDITVGTTLQVTLQSDGTTPTAVVILGSFGGDAQTGGPDGIAGSSSSAASGTTV